MIAMEKRYIVLHGYLMDMERLLEIQLLYFMLINMAGKNVMNMIR
jgi:hypothetical protein